MTSLCNIALCLQRGTLHDELERRRLASSPLPQSTLVSLFRSVCLAVRELHQSSPPLAHRDIKVRGRLKRFYFL